MHVCCCCGSAVVEEVSADWVKLVCFDIADDL